MSTNSLPDSCLEPFGHNRIPIGRRLWRDWLRQTRWWVCIDCNEMVPDDQYQEPAMARINFHAHNGECQNCGNYADKLFIRARESGSPTQLRCELCCLMESKNSGRMTEGRHNRGGEPFNQPPAANMFGKPRPCELCSQPAQPEYLWEGEKHTFCGWAHAGLWMDREMDVEYFDEVEAEDYVKRSLGIND